MKDRHSTSSDACRRFRDALHVYASGHGETKDIGGELAAHIDVCCACKRELAFTRRIVEAIESHLEAIRLEASDSSATKRKMLRRLMKMKVWRRIRHLGPVQVTYERVRSLLHLVSGGSVNSDTGGVRVPLVTGSGYAITQRSGLVLGR